MSLSQTNIFSIGLGLTPPWKLVEERLDTDKVPYELHLRIEAERASEFPCPECGKLCKAHDFKPMTWRHLNFFQHHCYLTAPVPRTSCPDHGIKRANVPWAREGSAFTLLFEQTVLVLARQLPIVKIAEFAQVTDKRLWRIIDHYVTKAIGEMDLTDLAAIAIDETTCAKGQKYVSVVINPEQDVKPVVFAYPGKDSITVKTFVNFLSEHGGKAENISEVVSDMSGAFLSATKREFPNAAQTIDWFHVVKLFNKAIDEVRRKEAHAKPMPRGTRWATLKGKQENLTETEIEALAKLASDGYETSISYRIKETLRWVRAADSVQGARWRLTWFINHAEKLITNTKLLQPVTRALNTIKDNYDRIVNRWSSGFSNARLEALNGIFQLARKRARGFRNVDTFIQMIYLLGAPIEKLVFST